LVDEAGIEMDDLRTLAIAVIAQAVRDLRGADRPDRAAFAETMLLRLRPRVDAARFLVCPTREQRYWFALAGLQRPSREVTDAAQGVIRRYRDLMAWSRAHPHGRLTDLVDDGLDDLVAA
jgi:hypothetical protein